MEVDYSYYTKEYRQQQSLAMKENWKLKIENYARAGRGAVGLLSLHPNFSPKIWVKT